MMKKAMMFLFVGCVALVLISGCGSKEDKAESVVKAGLEALKDGDIDKAMESVDMEGMVEEMKKMMEPVMAMMPEEEKKKALAEMNVEKMKEQAKADFEKQKLEFDYEIISSEPSGENNVVVNVKITEKGKDEQEMPLIMKQIDGKWKLDIMATGKGMETASQPAAPAPAPAE
jgi:PBP1b-binding outer membrane lipoprotein LpoB